MLLGNRNIRSAGRTSGSVEITLPIELAVLEGITCQVTLRDGLNPEIVLQPDLRAAIPMFETLWDRLKIGFETVADIGDFSEVDYALGLFPAPRWRGRPSLAYTDALAVQHHLVAHDEDRQCALEAGARLIEAMATVAGGRLALPSELAGVFGSEVAWLASNAPIGAADDFARGLTVRTVVAGGGTACERENLLNREKWIKAQGALAQVYERFAAWRDEPQIYASTREAWYRARRFETRVAAARSG